MERSTHSSNTKVVVRHLTLASQARRPPDFVRLVLVVPDLGHDEELLPAALLEEVPHALPHLVLVSVHGRTVYVPVAQLDCLPAQPLPDSAVLLAAACTCAPGCTCTQVTGSKLRRVSQELRQGRPVCMKCRSMSGLISGALGCFA